MTSRLERLIENSIFASRWLQMPLYLGLIVASCLYCYKFVMEVVHLCMEVNQLTEEAMLLAILGLVDVSMVLNLVYVVIIGGYTMFISKIDLDSHPDRPEWLDHTNANTLKIKLAASLVGVSGIHLLKTFIELGHILRTGGQEAHSHAESTHLASEMVEQAAVAIQNVEAMQHPENLVMWQVIIHATFLFSAIALALTERMLHPPVASHSSSGESH